MDNTEVNNLIKANADGGPLRNALKTAHRRITAAVKDAMSRPTATVVPAGAAVSMLEITSCSNGYEYSYDSYLERMAEQMGWDEDLSW